MGDVCRRLRRSTDEALAALAPLTSNLKVDALARCLQRSVPPPTALLQVTVPPDSSVKWERAAVRLDGRLVALLGSAEPLEITAGRGRHVVTLSLGGYDDLTIAQFVDLHDEANGSVTVDDDNSIAVGIDEAPFGGLPETCTELHVSLMRLSSENYSWIPVMKRLDAVLLAAGGEVQDVTDLFKFEHGAAATARCGELEQRLSGPAPWQLLVAGHDADGRAIASVREVWRYRGLLRGRVAGVEPNRSKLDVIIVRTSDGKQYVGLTKENGFTANLPPGEYTVTPLQATDAREEYNATQKIEFTGERTLDFTLTKAGAAPRYVEEWPLIPVVHLGFSIDDAGQHFVPTDFVRGQRLRRDVRLASAAGVAQAALFESTRPYIVVETYDAQGRFLWRSRMTGGFQHQPLAPLPGMQLGVTLPLAGVKQVRVYGRPQEQPVNYDIGELAKLEKKE